MKTALTFLLAHMLFLILSVHALARETVLIQNASIVDVEAGTVSNGQSLLLEGGTITAIGPDIAVPSAEAVTFDAQDQFLIPGLWDSHVHIFSNASEPETALPLYLINGVTGIRDMGALWSIDAQKRLQTQIEKGEVLGPRIILSGAWVDGAPGSWPGMFLADTPQEARDVVAQIADEGWAAVKSYSMLNEPTYQALGQAATGAGLPLVGHIPEQVTLGTALAAQQDGIEHFGRVTMACSTREAEMVQAIQTAMDQHAELSQIFAIMADRNAIILRSWDEALCNQVLGQMAGARMHISPTLVVADFYTGNWPAPDTPRMRMIPTAVRTAWAKPDFRLQAMTDELRALADASIALDRKTFRMAHDAGVPILASSDASFANPYLFHGFSLLDELDIYVRAGLTPQEALFTATIAPPRFLQLADQDGTIAVGRRADLVLLDKNPLDGLATLRSPVAVIAGGTLLDANALSALRTTLIQAGQ